MVGKDGCRLKVLSWSTIDRKSGPRLFRDKIFTIKMLSGWRTRFVDLNCLQKVYKIPTFDPKTLKV
jgi:hypothetical protein